MPGGETRSLNGALNEIDERQMTRRTFADELEKAADHIADVSRAELQILLRLAVFRLRNTDGLTIDPDVDEAVDLLAAERELPRAEVVKTIIRDWLVSGGRIPGNARTQESETGGTP